MKKKIIRFTTGLTIQVKNGTKYMTRRLTTDRRQYEVGERVALAESYGHIWRGLSSMPSRQADYMNRLRKELDEENPSGLISWYNKLYVRADLMQYDIQILSKRKERLHDITDEDIMREGVFKSSMECVNIRDGKVGNYAWREVNRIKKKDGLYHLNIVEHIHSDIRECFAEMIDSVCGKGTWDSNPEVWVYGFKAIDLYPDFTVYSKDNNE